MHNANIWCLDEQFYSRLASRSEPGLGCWGRLLKNSKTGRLNDTCAGCLEVFRSKPQKVSATHVLDVSRERSTGPRKITHNSTNRLRYITHPTSISPQSSNFYSGHAFVYLCQRVPLAAGAASYFRHLIIDRIQVPQRKTLHDFIQ